MQGFLQAVAVALLSPILFPLYILLVDPPAPEEAPRPKSKPLLPANVVHMGATNWLQVFMVKLHAADPARHTAPCTCLLVVKFRMCSSRCRHMFAGHLCSAGEQQQPVLTATTPAAFPAVFHLVALFALMEGAEVLGRFTGPAWAESAANALLGNGRVGEVG